MSPKELEPGLRPECVNTNGKENCITCKKNCGGPDDVFPEATEQEVEPDDI